MTLQEITQLFSPNSYKDGLLLIVSPKEFAKLERVFIEKSRLQILICDGSLELEMNGKRYKTNGPSFIDIMDTATIQINECGQNLQAWCLFITFGFASESLKNLRPGPLNHLFKQMHLPIWSLSQEENRILENQLIQLKEVLNNSKHYYQKELLETFFKSFSLELGNIMFTHSDHADEKIPYINKKDFITLNFMKLATKYFLSEHNINFYAESLCLSNKHLTRIIKEMTGITPHAVIQNELLHYALVLLEDDNIPISQIAEELHFSDQSSFCKFFKKHRKISPMAYRRRKDEWQN